MVRNYRDIKLILDGMRRGVMQPKPERKAAEALGLVCS
eukprot:SAG11_NODE_36777_length_260_cov_0.515528_1_plen_37_part_10